MNSYPSGQYITGHGNWEQVESSCWSLPEHWTVWEPGFPIPGTHTRVLFRTPVLPQVTELHCDQGFQHPHWDWLAVPAEIRNHFYGIFEIHRCKNKYIFNEQKKEKSLYYYLFHIVDLRIHLKKTFIRVC